MSMKAYCMGNAIILAHVRFIAHGECNSKMYHSEVIRFNGHYQTLECDKMDVSGLCSGHKIRRKEFLERYCGGINPGAKKSKACYGVLNVKPEQS
ncbi:MAG: hypothetical protein WC769_08480 [Thermodesulfovibrionales bacterium]|jgi:hypothetical protein